ncbi:DUF6894 family protein [Sphingomonas sp. LR55]|uniref:DUF6894 family protein n=1 Tax=Sphingomonas sp. LR55 TaxID=3050231 RepID=UPI002FDF745C
MQRYFVNVSEYGRWITDDDGFLAPGLEVARQMAIAGAREIMAADILNGKLCVSTTIEILNENRIVLDRAWFKDFVHVSDG